MPVPGAYEPELEFSDPNSVRETALFSFNPLIYLYFMLSFLIVPYPIYQVIAKRYGWETNNKTMARHWSDLMLGFSYGTILFVFGNYTRAYSWITVIAFYPSLFGYALIAELPFTKTSLPNIKNWPFGMWAVFLTAVAIILAFAAFHIYWAATLPLPFVIYYICALLIPIFLFTVSLALIKENNENWARTWIHGYRVRWATRRSSKKSNGNDEEQPQQDEGVNPESSTSIDPVTQQQPNVPELYNPYTRKLNLHLHHWQIFYMLAFFTRFTHPVSQVGAGIVLACYMEGINAYGYDQLLND
ncbi:hypothetical protein BDB00DRAFT_924234 [Zychaea mexicana]|uniref:uncharacterized protein n=1 Tax=Zychaea mexicana TaxID=64656 RepID=UPI0022FE52A8|nr:uncharacterized protein BDB00DRAFT_924234 [Zychaea mexicana]KAI9499546.1 hypothetical protein BDB00DRAFT_924234 [Zychaea mexicana]